MIVEKLVRSLERLDSALTTVAPSASIAGSLSTVNELNHAFHSVSPLVSYLRKLLDEVQELKRVLEEQSDVDVEVVNTRSRRISELISSMVKDTLRSSNVLRMAMIAFVLSLIASSVTLFFYTTSSIIHVISAALAFFVIVMGGALILAIASCMNSSMLLVPLLNAVVVAQGAMYVSVNTSPESLTAMALSVAALVTAIVLTSRSIRNFRNALIYVIQLESAIESLASVLERSRPKAEIAVKEPEQHKPALKTTEQRRMAEIRALFERIYGPKASELLKYIEDVRKLSSSG